MQVIRTISGIIGLVALVWLGNTRVAGLPPIMKFIDPYHGFWQNAEWGLPTDTVLSFPEQMDEAKVVIDPRGVPHVFAGNEYDLYFLQGYLTARDRLWQMEFQTHAAAGRLSEIIGEKAVEFDREQRRMGMTYAAEQAQLLIEQDPQSTLILEAYAAGVNRFIAELDDRTLPIEYKLLDYKPEPWTPFKSALLLKYMAKMLTGTERDRSNTEALKLLGEQLFWKLYPDQTYLEDPIVPGFKVDSVIPVKPWTPSPSTATSWNTPSIQPHFVGSNNWAVHGSRTQSGNAILCNDPHLKLSLPSIWYEIQLNGPGINCYGVSLPGSPGITIGFNEHIAWGVTNAGRDVKDYYAIELDGNTYRVGEKEFDTELRIEQIHVRNGHTVLDTVRYTIYGPIAYQQGPRDQNLALRWLAHDPSNELRTFYELNRATCYDDYTKALSYFNCPGQNFVYADVQNNIAIWQQGKFRLKPEGYGKFILNGKDPYHLHEAFIPQQHNPHVLNPERGFVSSANQAAVDSSYPYYISGVYEEFRNRTINRFLRSDSSVTVKEMQALQLSNYDLLAAEALPLMLSLLDTSSFLNREFELLALNELRNWNYSNDPGIIAPTIFKIWWDEFQNLLWDEFNKQDWDQNMYYRYFWEELSTTGKADVDMRDERYVYPMNKVALDLLEHEPDHVMFDHHASNNKRETAKDIVYDSFYWTVVKFRDIIKYKFSAPHWGHYKGTRVQHLMRLDAFSSEKLFVGGSEHAPNAITPTHGPSWRMIVELDPNGVKAYGVLPGGQSGNPGNKNCSSSLETWSNGEYHRLHLLRKPEKPEPDWHTLRIVPQP